MVNQCKVSAADAPLDFIWGIWVRQAEQAAETGIWFGPYSICSSGLFVIFGVYPAEPRVWRFCGLGTCSSL